MNRWLGAALVAVAAGHVAAAEPLRGTVVDQTGLVVPGVRVELRSDDRVVAAATTTEDGRFELPEPGAAASVTASLDGFEPVTVSPDQAAHIVLRLAGTAETTTVSASDSLTSAVMTSRIGSSLTPQIARRLPSARPRALESLPMLPSVVRGPDGLLRIGGTKPHEAALLIDGFDVTDPVTGTSPIDLPLESVKTVAVLRDPMVTTFGGVLGALATIDTASGGEDLAAGVQSFVPHPRLSRHGFGTIDGFFPRVHASGPFRSIRWAAAQEYDLERIAVPDVTARGGPAAEERAVTTFVRVDAPAAGRQAISVEGLFVSMRADDAGLSPLRPASVTTTMATRDLLGGIVDRIAVSQRDVLTLRAGIIAHGGASHTNGAGPARLTPFGWRGNWFASSDYDARRTSFSAAWDRVVSSRVGPHRLSAEAGAQQRVMRGSVGHRTIQIEDAQERPIRRIDFGPAPPLEADDAPRDVAVQDHWDAGDRVQLEAGLRLDWTAGRAERAVSPRLGVRFALDSDQRTILRVGAGRFVGRLPLHARAYSRFASRTDTTFDPETGEELQVRSQEPAVGVLRLPRADSVTIEVERQVRPGLDLQVGARQRVGSALPTVEVGPRARIVQLDSVGRSTYRELQFAVRQVWNEAAQVFVSYVRSLAQSELNDFGSLYSALEAPYLERGGRAPATADAPSRLLLWGIVGLPRDFAVAPAAEWHTGFPYSDVDVARHYQGLPNQSRFPRFFSLDLVAYRTVSIRQRRVDLGAQMFNLTGHFNPRDVMTVTGTSEYRHLMNSIGLKVTGYMVVKWQ